MPAYMKSIQSAFSKAEKQGEKMDDFDINLVSKVMNSLLKYGDESLKASNYLVLVYIC